MNKDNKYYTPEIIEFHVEFEYEAWDVKSDENWIKHIVPEKGYVKHPHEEIRVKHLDREDIESLGFKHEDKNEFLSHYVKNDSIRIFWNKNNPSFLSISEGSHVLDLRDRFRGIIKNKSVLIQVLKMIGV